MMKTTYSPVYPEFYDIFKEEQAKNSSRIIYFDEENNLEEAQGKIVKIETNNLNEEYMYLDSGSEVRIDRIITVNGKLGPAFAEYENYGIECHMCMGGSNDFSQI